MARRKAILNLTDLRAGALRAAQIELLNTLGPDGVAREVVAIERADAPVPEPRAQMLLPHLCLPEHHDVRPADVVMSRLWHPAAAANAGP